MNGTCKPPEEAIEITNAGPEGVSAICTICKSYLTGTFPGEGQ